MDFLHQITLFSIFFGIAVNDISAETCRTTAVMNGVCVIFASCPSIQPLIETLSLAEFIRKYGGCGKDSSGNTRLCCPEEKLDRIPAEIRPQITPAGVNPVGEQPSSSPNPAGNCGLRVVGQGQEFPFLVALGRVLQDGNFNVYCSGIIISQSWIVTDAQCIFDHFISVAKIGLNTNKARFVDISERIPNDSYDPETKVGNIGMVKLAVPIEFDDFVQPACLPSSETTRLRPLMAVTIESPSYGADKNKIFPQTSVVNHYTKEKCESFYNGPFYNQDTICTSPATIHPSLGGRLVLLRRDLQTSRFMLQGLGGKEPRLLIDAHVYSNIDFYLPWIKALIA